jgi:hypothetical protein
MQRTSAFLRTTFRELLKRGHSLVIVNVDDPDLASAAKHVFERQGTEDIDEVRKLVQRAA